MQGVKCSINVGQGSGFKFFLYTTLTKIVLFLQVYRVFFDVLPTVHLSIFVLVLNQLDAQNFCFTINTKINILIFVR